MKYRHNKTGKTYSFFAKAIDATNVRSGNEIVIYRNEEGKFFVRDKEEFYQKFSEMPNKCSICGTIEGVFKDSRDSYRCNGADCVPY